MKKLFSSTACIVACCICTPAAEASELAASLKRFCDAARTLNNSGLSVAPGTQVGKAIQREAKQSTAIYQTVFTLAKNSHCPNLY